MQLLVNNAGVYGPDITLETVAAADLLQTFTTNAIGPLLVTQQLCKHQLLQQGSVIANITSKVRDSWD
jgi:NAD(P)-dependent dehydrogenase (short-subunit alcohol dehydrogenase family)